MDRELAVVLGMTLSYVASLAGMFIGMWAYRKRRRPPSGGGETRGRREEPAS